MMYQEQRTSTDLQRSIYYNVFRTKLAAKLPAEVAAFSIAAGLPMTEVKDFLGVFLTNPAEAASLPGITEKILDAALLGSETAYAQSLRYVWYAISRHV